MQSCRKHTDAINRYYLGGLGGGSVPDRGQCAALTEASVPPRIFLSWNASIVTLPWGCICPVRAPSAPRNPGVWPLASTLT